MLHVIKDDITSLQVDAIVNAANPALMGGGGGVDGAIHRAGGRAIAEACREIVSRQGECRTGEAIITGAGKLPAKFVIHTVGPIWRSGMYQEQQLLADCYRNSLKLAIDHQCRSIAFPNISTGVYAFPKGQAAITAVSAVRAFLSNHQDLTVVFVCFDDENYRLTAHEVSKSEASDFR